jgi:hypothetical protein
MFCANCGTQIGDGERFCPNCGAPVAPANDEIKGFSVESAGENSSFAGADTQNTTGAAAGMGAQNTQNAGAGYAYAGNGAQMPLKTDRSLLMFVLLSIVTCGIYYYIFVYQMIKDVNVACEGDGEETPGLLMFVLLSIVTCSIYAYIWYYKIGDRLCNNCARYGMPTTENGTAVLLWMLFGRFLCCVGPFIAWNILITNTNTVCMGYNRAHGLAG